MLEPEEVSEWIKKAENDYAGALHIHRRRKKPLPDLVCFHCQQAAEKYLKAFLIFKEVSFPKIHDLLALLELCQRHRSDFELWREPFELLNPYSVQLRYPGEEASVEEARVAVQAVKQIRTFMRSCVPREQWPAAEE